MEGLQKWSSSSEVLRPAGLGPAGEEVAGTGRGSGGGAAEVGMVFPRMVVGRSLVEGGGKGEESDFESWPVVWVL